MSHFKLYLSLESTPLPSDRETKKKTTLESTMITSSPSRLISFYSEFIVVSTFEILLKYVFVFSFLKNSAIFQTHIMLQLKFKKLKCSLTYSLTSFSSVNFGFMFKISVYTKIFYNFLQEIIHIVCILCVSSYLLLTNVYLRGML